MRFARPFGPGLAAGVIVAVAFVGTAHAQDSARGDKVAAEALFEDARKLVATGNYADACPKFADSERLDPSAATLLNLASCFEKLGHKATAWATYREAASAANAAGRADYVTIAQKHADALAVRLARLTLNVPQPTEGVVVQRDGVVVAPAEWGVAIPVDVGSHAVAANAPGHKPWMSSIDVSGDGALAVVNVPPLEPMPVDAANAAAPPTATDQPRNAAVVAPPSGPTAFAPQARTTNGGAQRLSGWILGGLGVVGIGVGTALAVVATNKYQDSLGNCEKANLDLCTAQGLATRNDARSAGDAASWALGLGAVAVVGGVVLWLTAPSNANDGAASRVALAVVPTLGGAVVQGSW
jgi:hypothetical protein